MSGLTITRDEYSFFIDVAQAYAAIPYTAQSFSECFLNNQAIKVYVFVKSKTELLFNDKFSVEVSGENPDQRQAYCHQILDAQIVKWEKADENNKLLSFFRNEYLSLLIFAVGKSINGCFSRCLPEIICVNEFYRNIGPGPELSGAVKAFNRGNLEEIQRIVKDKLSGCFLSEEQIQEVIKEID